MIRAFAVLCVLFGHLHDLWTGRPSLLGWHFAQIGVLIFFVHTSFVLMCSMERGRLHGNAMVKSFYLRRVFRIYPLSIFCVTVAMLLHYSPVATAPVRHWSLTEYLSNLLLTQNLTYTDNMVGGLWTLPLEVEMYVLLPFLFLLGRRKRVWVLGALWAFSIPLALLQIHTSARLNMLGYAPCFLAGVIAWKLSLTARRRIPGWLWPLGFAATWPLFFVANHGDDMYFRWLFCLGLGLAVPWFRELTSRWVTMGAHQVAKYSYSIYLSHVGIIMAAMALPVSRPVQAAVIVCGCAAVPVALYHGLEHPLIDLGQRLAKWLYPPPRAAAATPQALA